MEASFLMSPVEIGSMFPRFEFIEICDEISIQFFSENNTEIKIHINAMIKIKFDMTVKFYEVGSIQNTIPYVKFLQKLTCVL